MRWRALYLLAAGALGLGFPLCALIFTHLGGGPLDGRDLAAFAAQARAGQPMFDAIALAPVLFAVLGFVAGGRLDKSLRATAALRLELDRNAAALSRIGHDLEARKRLESQLAHRAFHDPLTNLANRALFVNRAEHALVRAGNNKHAIAVLRLDLDDFKTINDMLGHDAGDRVLGFVAQRFASVLRPGDTLARLAGDEFALLLERVPNIQEAVATAQRLSDALSMPISSKDRQVRVAVSIGIACGRSDSEVETLLRDAGLAMQEAKLRGKGALRVFRPELHSALLERVKLGGDLHRAIAEEQFFLMYQPIVELRSERIVGMEALVRWNHPKRGTIPPLDFIKLAEDTGAIVPLGGWILRAACHQVAAWQHARPADELLTITVNVSPLQLLAHAFVDEVRAALATSGLAPASLVLEITESALVDDTAETLARFVALKALGIRLAIDDFGTGYSSLSYLQRFPFDILKIDKSFVDGVAGAATDVAFARTIIALGGMLNLRVLAEGIEHRPQLTVLKELGCGYGQGYLFAKPLDAAAMNALLDGAKAIA